MTTEEVLESMRFIARHMQGYDCGCDPEVNFHCETCGIISALGDGVREIERLQSIIAAHLHQRKCHDCGSTMMSAPLSFCPKCRSGDTRRVKE